MMNKSVCVIGAGYWGGNHINTLINMRVDVGIVDPNKERLNFFSKNYPKIRIHTDLNDALSHDYSAYIVSSPAETHFLIAKKLIKSKKHVLVEKPLALSVIDAENLVLLAEENKTTLMVGHVLLFHPAIAKMKKMILEGKIGDMQYLYSNRLNLGKVRSEENVFWSFAPHDIAIFQHLTNSYPKKIISRGSDILQKGISDSTLTHIEYKNNIKGHIFVSWLHPFKEHRIVVIGSEGMLTFEDSSDGKPLKYYSKKFDLTNGYPEKVDGPIAQISYEKKLPLSLELDYFLEHANGTVPDLSNMYHGLEVVKILVESSEHLNRD